MCTGVELLLGLGALGSAASMLFQSEPEVPEAQPLPASPADAARESGSTVRVGTRDEEEDDLIETEDGEFVPRRKQAQVITGLGKGGLAL